MALPSYNGGWEMWCLTWVAMDAPRPAHANCSFHNKEGRVDLGDNISGLCHNILMNFPF